MTTRGRVDSASKFFAPLAPPRLTPRMSAAAVLFSGYAWSPRRPAGPGDPISIRNFELDGGSLKLNVVPRMGAWAGAWLKSISAFGLGTLNIKIFATIDNFSANLVVGVLLSPSAFAASDDIGVMLSRQTDRNATRGLLYALPSPGTCNGIAIASNKFSDVLNGSRLTIRISRTTDSLVMAVYQGHLDLGVEGVILNRGILGFRGRFSRGQLPLHLMFYPDRGTPTADGKNASITFPPGAVTFSPPSLSPPPIPPMPPSPIAKFLTPDPGNYLQDLPSEPCLFSS